MIRSIVGAAAGCAAALVLTGCAAKPPTIVPGEGVVVLNGEPLPHAFVQFVPMIQGFGAEYIATATTDEHGRFKLTCNGQDGVCACENRVTVIDGSIPDTIRGNQTAEGKFLASLKNRPIPAVYGSVADTPLVITVSADQTVYKLNLTR